MPYRELPKYLLCPRCGEMLSREMEGVSTCLRCEGLWIASAVLDAAFGDPRWPAGHSQWWRNSLDCPACSFEGRQTQMAARMADSVLVDQCPDHGLWLDRGELGRLMGTTGDELSVLRDQMHVAAPELERLSQRRDRWRTDLETRRRIAAEYHQSHAEAERVRSAREAERARQRDTTPPPPRPPEPPSAYHEASARRAMRFQELSTQRAQTASEIERLESQLGVMREHALRLDEELARTLYRASAIERELGASRDRLRALDLEISP